MQMGPELQLSHSCCPRPFSLCSRLPWPLLLRIQLSMRRTRSPRWRSMPRHRTRSVTAHCTQRRGQANTACTRWRRATQPHASRRQGDHVWAPGCIAAMLAKWPSHCAVCSDLSSSLTVTAVLCAAPVLELRSRRSRICQGHGRHGGNGHVRHIHCRQDHTSWPQVRTADRLTVCVHARVATVCLDRG